MSLSIIENFMTDPHTALGCLMLAIWARLSPAGRWNYKRTQWLQKRNEKFKKYHKKH